MVAAEPCHGDAAGLTLAPLPYLGATPERGNLGRCGRPGVEPPAEIRGHLGDLQLRRPEPRDPSARRCDEALKSPHVDGDSKATLMAAHCRLNAHCRALGEVATLVAAHRCLDAHCRVRCALGWQEQLAKALGEAVGAGGTPIFEPLADCHRVAEQALVLLESHGELSVAGRVSGLVNCYGDPGSAIVADATVEVD